jgi:PIN domain nuclease of toxin-antitoxin system
VDTQAVIWLTGDAAQLSQPAWAALEQGRRSGELAIADITLGEIAELIARGRITAGRQPEGYLGFVESLFRVVPIDARIARQSAQFSAKYPKDPADRLIGATAIVHGAKLVTKDAGIRGSGEVQCVW